MNAEPSSKKQIVVYCLLTIICALLAWTYATAETYLNWQYRILIPISFISLGALIKYADQSFDGRGFSQSLSRTIAIPCGIWMGALIFFDAGSATIFIGLLLALLIASKYDNSAFQIGFVVASLFALLSFVNYPNNVSVVGIPVVFVTAFLDERLSDLADKHKAGRLWRLARERPLLKIAILALCIISVLPSYLYFFAFLGFDLGYSTIERYAELKEADLVAI